MVYLESINQAGNRVVRGNRGLLACDCIFRRADGSVVDLEIQIAHFLIEELSLATARNVEYNDLTGEKGRFIVTGQVLAVFVSGDGGRLRAVHERV